MNRSLYLVTDSKLCGKKNIVDVVLAAVNAGVKMVQLREKKLSHQDFVELAMVLSKKIKKYRVPLIINDNMEVAIAVNADGVHLGQTDTSYTTARRLLGYKKIIGLSVNNKLQLQKANQLGVDYLGIGPIFSTLTKLDAASPLGVNQLAVLCRQTTHKTYAIGGINKANIKRVMATGVNGVALVSAICSAENVDHACQSLIKAIKNEKTL